MNTDPYPTDEELERVQNWDLIGDPAARGFMAYVKALWWMPEWGWHESDGTDELFNRPVHIYEISTGGWSGNESLIYAMEHNFIFWSLYWVQARRGGHYIFYTHELPKETQPISGVTG